MQAMIFAAGLGTRLKPLTDTMPKALVKVDGRPLLEHTIMRLRDAGAERIVINVHHFANQIVDYLRSNDNFGLDIRVSDETDALLDTGGGIKKAADMFDSTSPVLIHNVDILSNIDLRRFYDAGSQADATLLVSSRATTRYLLFAKDGSRQLKGWTNVETGEIRSPHSNLSPDTCDMYAFSGIHLFSPRLFSCFNAMPSKFGIVDFYLKYCAVKRIEAYVKDDLLLMDVGKIDTLAEADAFAARLNAGR